MAESRLRNAAPPDTNRVSPDPIESPPKDSSRGRSSTRSWRQWNRPQCVLAQLPGSRYSARAARFRAALPREFHGSSDGSSPISPPLPSPPGRGFTCVAFCNPMAKIPGLIPWTIRPRGSIPSPRKRALRGLYEPPMELAALKQLDGWTAHCRNFLAHSPFAVIGSTRPGSSTDVSPRGDAPGFAGCWTTTPSPSLTGPGKSARYDVEYRGRCRCRAVVLHSGH